MNFAPSISRRKLLTTGAALAMSGAGASAQPPSPVLIELFTSQGCSSCPPADKLAAELAATPENYVVSFNVDYWDYLGWRDTLARPEYSQRQYDYAKAMGDGGVYTPQMVINGSAHVVGSQRSSVQQLITSQRNQPLAAQVKLAVSDKDIVVNIASASITGEATLWLMAVESRVTQHIQRGENAGNDISYVNVVRNLVPAAMWKGEAYEGRWMKEAVMPHGCTSCLAVIQQDKVGPVMGLARS